MFNITGLKALLPVQITVRALCTRLATPVIRIAIIELPFIQTIRDIIFVTYTHTHTDPQITDPWSQQRQSSIYAVW